MRFFRKFDPRQAVMLSDGSWFRFTEVAGAQSEYGILATTDGHLISELTIAHENQRGGIREITEAEFHELKKKEVKQTRWQPSNESISKRAYRRLCEQWQGVSAGVAGVVKAVDRGLGRKIERPVVQNTFRPVSVRR